MSPQRRVRVLNSARYPASQLCGRCGVSKQRTCFLPMEIVSPSPTTRGARSATSPIESMAPYRPHSGAARGAAASHSLSAPRSSASKWENDTQRVVGRRLLLVFRPGPSRRIPAHHVARAADRAPLPDRGRRCSAPERASSSDVDCECADAFGGGFKAGTSTHAEEGSPARARGPAPSRRALDAPRHGGTCHGDLPSC